MGGSVSVIVAVCVIVGVFVWVFVGEDVKVGVGVSVNIVSRPLAIGWSISGSGFLIQPTETIINPNSQKLLRAFNFIFIMFSKFAIWAATISALDAIS